MANKGVARQGVRKSGRERTYRRAFLRFSAEFAEITVGGPPPPGVFVRGKLVRAETKGVSGWGWEVDLMGHGSTEMLVCQENYAMVYGDVGSLMKKRGLRPAWGKDQRVCSR